VRRLRLAKLGTVKRERSVTKLRRARGVSREGGKKVRRVRM
jgi:hypothetical protein